MPLQKKPHSSIRSRIMGAWDLGVGILALVLYSKGHQNRWGTEQWGFTITRTANYTFLSRPRGTMITLNCLTWFDGGQLHIWLKHFYCWQHKCMNCIEINIYVIRKIISGGIFITLEGTSDEACKQLTYLNTIVYYFWKRLEYEEGSDSERTSGGKCS